MTEHTVPDDERDDVNVTAVFAFAVGFVAVAVAIHALVWLLFAFFAGRQAAATTREYPLAAAEENRLPPEPRLQTNPRQDLNDLRAEEDRTLNSYVWVDKSGGIVRIPIDEAMRLTIERGLSTRIQGKNGRP